MMMASTAFQVLCQAAEKWPHKAAVVDAGNLLTFAELHARTLACARAFVGAGFEHGDRFAIWAPNSINWQLATMAGQAVGCVLVPLNTRFRAREAEDIVKRSRVRGLFYCDSFLDTDYADMVDAIKAPHLAQRIDLGLLEDWTSELDSGQSVDGKIASVSGDCLADVLYTSGTTGAPKGVMCTHEQNIRVFETWSAGVTLRESDNYLIINPYFHSFGYKAGWLAALIRGATIFPMQVFDATSVLELIEQSSISFLPGAPTIFQSLLAHPERSRFDTSSLRCAVTGAASVPVQLVRDMKHKLGFEEVYTAYGLTESTGVVSLCKPGDDFETIANTSGRPMDSIEVQITAPDGLPLPHGEQGEIWVRGFNVMKGYLDDEEATAVAVTSDGWLKTGDIGIMDERGYLKITDRLKDMYICGGFNCYPAEIEQILLAHPEIKDVAVLGVPDERLGEVGCAFVVTSGEAAPDGIIEWARNHMANYKAPRRVSFVDALPRNASGKVQKFQLRKRLSNSCP